MRSAGGHGHGHEEHGHGHDEHHAAHYEKSKYLNTQFKVPTQADLDYQLPKKGIFNDKWQQWLSGRWQVDRDDILDNDKVKKNSAYYWFGNMPL